MARGEQITRHWRMLQMMQRRGVGLTLRELGTELEVSERTLQRDFELLQEVGFPVAFEEDDVGRRYWRLPADYFKTGPLTLSLTEAISLHLAEHLLAPLAGTHFAEGLRSTLDNIRSQLPVAALDYFRALDETLYVRRAGLTDYSPHADAIALLVAAARDRRCVEFAYRSLWRSATYATRFDPYGLVYFDGDLFLVGRSHRADAVRVMKINRLSDVRTTDERFKRPAGLRLEDYFRSSFGIVRSSGQAREVVVRFTGAAAALVEERLWHETQRLERDAPERTLFKGVEERDALRATFKLTDFVEFKRWIKGFGPAAEVLRPADLRAELRAELQAAADRHA